MDCTIKQLGREHTLYFEYRDELYEKIQIKLMKLNKTDFDVIVDFSLKFKILSFTGFI